MIFDLNEILMDFYNHFFFDRVGAYIPLYAYSGNKGSQFHLLAKECY